MTNTVKELYIDGKFRGYVDNIDAKVEIVEKPMTYKVEVCANDMQVEIHDWLDDEITLYSLHRDYEFDRKIKDLYVENEDTNIDDYDGLSLFVDALNKNSTSKIYKIIDAYIHSGVAIHEHPYSGPDAKWDSGCFMIAEFPKENYSEDVYSSAVKTLDSIFSNELYIITVLNVKDVGIDSYFHLGNFDDNAVKDIMETLNFEDYNLSKADLDTAIDNIIY